MDLMKRFWNLRSKQPVERESHEQLIDRIKCAVGVGINEIREHPALCISCGASLGFAALQTIAPPRGSFAFRARFACTDCGQKAATLALMEERGNG